MIRDDMFVLSSDVTILVLCRCRSTTAMQCTTSSGQHLTCMKSPAWEVLVFLDFLNFFDPTKECKSNDGINVKHVVCELDVLFTLFTHLVIQDVPALQADCTLLFPGYHTKFKAQVSGSCLCSSIMFMFKNSACTGTESAVQKCIGVGSVYLYLSTCAPYQSSEAAFGFLTCGFGCWSAKVTSKKNVETWLQLNTFMQGVKLACTWSTNTAWASRRACIQTWSCTGGAYKSLHAHRTTSSEHHMWWIPSTHHWLDLHVSWWSVNAFQRPRVHASHQRSLVPVLICDAGHMPLNASILRRGCKP